MTRLILEPDRIHPAARDKVTKSHRIGGADELEALLASGELSERLRSTVA